VRRWRVGEARGQLVAATIGREALPGARDDRPEELSVAPCRDAQRLEVARAGRLDVAQSARRARELRIDRQLVRSGVEAELVAAERARDRRVVVQAAPELGAIPAEVDALLERAGEARCDAGERHAVLEELLRADPVLRERGRRGRLVDAELDLVVACAE